MYMPFDPKAFSQKLRELRKERDLSQAEVAKAVGVDKQHVSNWENSRTKPSLDSVVALCEFLGISIDYLIFDNVPREGVEAINDFELYQYFRKTEALPKEHKETIKDVIDSIVFRDRVTQIPEGESYKQIRSAPHQALRKIAEKR